jgi:signal transduction histidine kinase
MLSSRRIRLDCDLPAGIDVQFPDRTRAVVGLAIQEGAANILRHARESTTASLLIERLPGGDAGLTMTNVAAADAPDTHNALSGGYGLADLTEVVAGAGGTVLYGAADAMWRLIVTVPALRGTGPGPAVPGGAPGDPR